ncbi:MAG: hypothetical protein HIU88_00880 [Acidobacteria bacterium]|nr:hypothetical protein [Acidobacteriota bacterium]
MERATADKHLLIHAYGETSETLSVALRAARNAANEFGPEVGIHIVVQGPAVEHLTTQSGFAHEIRETVASDSIEVAACSNSLGAVGIDTSQLADAVGSVPSAVAYIAQKQWEGWAYVRF